MNRTEFALDKFRNGYNCSQAVLSAFAADFNLDVNICLRVASAFGGGIARNQKTCGAVTGALMAIGLNLGATQPHDQHNKTLTYKASNKFKLRFIEKFGSTDCLQLLGADLKTDEGRAIIEKENLFVEVCEKCVAHAVQMAEDLAAPVK